MSAGLIRLTILLCTISTLLIAGMIIFGFWMFDFALVRKEKMDFDAGDDLLPHMDIIRLRAREAQEKITHMHPEDVYIRSHDGLRLHATFVPCTYFSRKVVIAVHGYNSYGMFDMSSVVPYFRGMGFNVIIVDNRAHGSSEGKYIGFGWLDRMDILNWIRYATSRFGQNCEILLHGVSMGAATVLMTCGEAALPHQVKGVIADCPFAGAYEEFGYIMRSNYRVPGRPLLYFASGVCRLRAGYSFRDCSTLRAVKNIRIPVLFIHGTDDTFVPPKMTEKMYKACHAKQKYLYMVPKATHCYSAFQDMNAYVRQVSDFVYNIEHPEEEEPAESSPGQLVSAEKQTAYKRL